jgi:AcrR family transcriptional regulator
MTFSESAYEVSSGWQDRALRRSLDRARGRSLERMTRLVAAARDLANDTGSAEFTVVQVARRAGFSLKAFYQCFSGKDELLLALVEEDSGMGAYLLADHLSRYSDPVERVRTYVEGLFELLTHPGAVGYAGVLVREHRRLGEGSPGELEQALAPLVDLLASELAAVDAAGRAEIRDPARAAATVFGVLLGGINDVTTGQADPTEMAAWLWQFCWSGLAGPRHNPEVPTTEASTTGAPTTDDREERSP